MTMTVAPMHSDIPTAVATSKRTERPEEVQDRLRRIFGECRIPPRQQSTTILFKK